MDILKEIKQDGSIDKVISASERIDLSGDDIVRLSGGAVNIMAYEDLEGLTNLSQVFGQYTAVALLYQTGRNFGHWVTLLNRGGRQLEFYDPYGLKVDEELNINNEFHLRIHNGVITPHLSALIQKGGWDVVSNSDRVQKMLEDVNTCGRYCALRVKFRALSMKEFNKMLTGNKHYDADMWVSALTLLI